MEFDWLKKVNDMLVEHDWLNMLIDTFDTRVTSFQLNKWNLQPPTWTLVGFVFIDGDANMNDSFGRKRTTRRLA
jgi:hypothetical protein